MHSPNEKGECSGTFWPVRLAVQDAALSRRKHGFDSRTGHKNLIKKTMANHKSALKRIRQTAKKAAHNRYYHKTTRNAVRRLRSTTDASEAAELLPRVASMLDKLAKRNIIHKKKASNLKSSLAKHVAAL